MLDAGLSTLDYLKSRILPAGVADARDWDVALAKLGLAVAGRFESVTNRRLARSTAQVDEFSANATALVLRAMPVETITSIQLRGFTGALEDFTAGYQLDAAAGLLLFEGVPGTATERLVITYTGGYWLDDGRTTQAAGATALPDELLEAWVMQCQSWAEARRVFGTVALSGQDAAQASGASPVHLTAEVLEILNPYRRFAGE